MIDGTSVTFSDGTICAVLVSRETELTCLVAGFDTTSLDTEALYGVTMSVNSKEDAS